MAATKSAVIIGAGIGGLATANLLAKAGWHVTVFEANDKAGGRAGLYEADGFRFDAGPSWYLMPEVFAHYYDLLGEDVNAHLQLQRLSPAYQVLFDYRDSLTVRADLQADAATFEAIEPGAGQRLQQYVAAADETYRLALQHFLYNPFTSFSTLGAPGIIKRSPKLVGLAGRTLDQYVSKRFKSLPLRQVLEYPAVFLGASPFQAPAIYHLMSTLDFTQGVYYPQGGLYGIAQSLQRIGQGLGVRYHFNTPVEAILRAGIRVAGSKVASDIVISNADRHYTDTQLLPPSARQAWKRKVSGPSALLMYLGVKGSLPQLQHHNLLFAEAWRQNFADIFEHKRWPKHPSIYMCKPSATDPSVAPAGHENMFVLVPLPAGAENLPDMEAYADRCLDSIGQHAGISDLRSRIVSRRLFGPADFVERFHAWQGTALGLSHTLGQSALFRPGNHSRTMPNLYYVGGDSRPGVGLPMCLIGAELVYKLLIDDHGAGPLSGLHIPKEWHV